MVAISQTKLQVLTEELTEPYNLDLTSSPLQVCITGTLLKAFYSHKEWVFTSFRKPSHRSISSIFFMFCSKHVVIYSRQYICG